MFAHQYLATAYDQAMGQNIDYSMIAHTIEDAEDSFVDAKERLLDVNNWHKYTDTAGIHFRLTDGHSRPVKRRARKGDHIWISVAGQKDCCVVIEALEYDDYPDLGMESFTMRICPCVHSMLPGDDDADLTGVGANLMIERRGRIMDAAFQSRNGIESFPGISGNWFGLSEIQWNRMLKNFVD